MRAFHVLDVKRVQDILVLPRHFGRVAAALPAMRNVEQEFHVFGIRILQDHIYFLGCFAELVHVVVVHGLHAQVGNPFARFVEQFGVAFQFVSSGQAVFGARSVSELDGLAAQRLHKLGMVEVRFQLALLHCGINVNVAAGKHGQLQFVLFQQILQLFNLVTVVLVGVGTQLDAPDAQRRYVLDGLFVVAAPSNGRAADGIQRLGGVTGKNFRHESRGRSQSGGLFHEIAAGMRNLHGRGCGSVGKIKKRVLIFRRILFLFLKVGTTFPLMTRKGYLTLIDRRCFLV